MQFVLQICTGAFFSNPSAETAVDSIRVKLEEALSLIDVRDVIIGWNTDLERNAAVLDIVHGYGKKAWLWLPVFSETNPAVKPEPQIGFSGKPFHPATSGMEEDFLFVCPSSEHNRALPLRMYDQYFVKLPFDGVFLDKIRQDGFSGGLERGVGCACGRCRSRYENAGVDFDKALRHIQDDPARLLPVARKGCRYQFADRDIDSFFAAKASCMTEAVALLAGAFRKRGLGVGLDVFAPPIAWYVGQDVQALSEIADFVKPMLYLRTNAPAGVLFELAALRDCIGAETTRTLQALWNARQEDEASCAKAQMAELARAGHVFWPGFEINRVPGVCDSDPSYVRAMARAYCDIGLGKMVLSWNLLHETGENLRALADI